MKLIFIFLLNLSLFSCNSNIKEHYSTDTGVVKRVDSMETIKDSPLQNSSLMEEEEKIIVQGNILSVKVENKLITLTVKNIYNKPIFYTSEIIFQKWNGSKWQKINFTDTYIFVSMEYILLPHDVRSHPFYFSSFAVHPVKGKYRVIKNYYFEDKIKKEEIKEFNID